MKAALIVLGCLAALIVIVTVIGAILPQHHIASRSARFRSSPEKLFSLISGPQTWRPDVKHYESVPNPGGLDRWRETDSGDQTIEYEIVDCRAPVLFKTRIATANLPFGGGWTFILHNDGTQTTVQITEESDVYNPIFRFVSKFIMGYTRSMDAYLTNLGKVVGEQVKIQD